MDNNKRDNSLWRKLNQRQNNQNNDSEEIVIPNRRERKNRNDNILTSDDYFNDGTGLVRKSRSGKKKDFNRGNSGSKGRTSGRRYSDNDYSDDDSYKKDDKRQRRSSGSTDRKIKPFDKDRNTYGKGSSYDRKPNRGGNKSRSPKKKVSDNDDMIRLNKFIADAGICSRRDADMLISTGSVKVNGVVVDTLGTKIHRTDKVQVGGETLSHEKLRYLLLNKPKGYITTTDDPQKRNTVMQLIQGACKERLYPVGRLDRNTLGLLLFTNDGELANKLMHPSSEIVKLYHVVLDKNLTRNDFKQIAEGLTLDDGFIKVDEIEYNPASKKEVGVKIHSGKNRIVRRIFEHLGYQVVKLDRTIYAGLTKKDLRRGHWRFLTEKEIGFLKML